MARGVILGRSGTGKSWFAGKMLEEIVPSNAPVVFDAVREDGGGEVDIDIETDFKHIVHIDIEDEEQGFSNRDNPMLMTFRVTPERLEQYVEFDSGIPSYIPQEEMKSGEQILLPKWAFYKYRYIRVVPDGLTDKETKVLVEMIADAAMLAGDTHFSLDEAHLVATKHGIGDRLMRLVTGGRKRGVEWLFITQRPQKIHEDILSQTDFTVYFNLRGRDKKKAAEKSEALDDAERMIDELEPRQAIVEDFDNGTWARLDTNELERGVPHVSGDDGKADDAYRSLFD